MDREEKKKGYRGLAVGVSVIALLATGAYLWNFWDWPPSDKTQDWANFATYISGTIGVAAVVATLMAFVITIRQQQSLVKSQDDMLQAQREQIKITEKLSSYERAYKGSFEIFPVLVDTLKETLAKPTKIYVRGMDVDSPDNAINYRFRTLHDYFLIGSSKNEIAQSAKKPFYADAGEYGPAQFQPIHEIVEFINISSAIDERLLSIFDYHLSKDLGYGKDGWFYIDCYREFQIGRHSQERFPAITRRESKKLIDDLFEKEMIALRWGEIGGNVIDEDWVYTRDWSE
uniref:Phage abortive infection protein n=1 Tax=Halomonas phage vB_HboP_4908 TaxID=3350578 RepID=A0AB74UKF8_9VIRU